MFYLEEGWVKENYTKGNFPEKCAVYSLVYNDVLLYVGCTNNLKQRINRHPKVAEIFNHFRDCVDILVYYIITEDFNSDFEARLINKHKPRYNLTIKSENSIEIKATIMIPSNMYKWVVENGGGEKSKYDFSFYVKDIIERQMELENIKK